MLTTTLNNIRHNRLDDTPCTGGWEKLLKHLGKAKADDAPLDFDVILESNGLEDALWCLRALPPEMDGPVRLLACDFAEAALKYVPEGEDRPRLAIEAARGFVAGTITDDELGAASAASIAASEAASEAASWASIAASIAASWSASEAASWASIDASIAASWSASEAALEALRAEQTERFIRFINEH